MFKRVGKITIFVLAVSLAAVLQFSLISALPGFFRQINIVLIILILTLFFLDFRSSLLAALIAGLWLDFLSFRFFGFYLLAFFLSLLLAQWILKNWLTNRSLYALSALMVGLTVVYNLLAAAILYITSAETGAFFLFRSGFWLALLYQGIWSLAASLILFNLAAMGSKRIKPFFLEKKLFM